MRRLVAVLAFALSVALVLLAAAASADPPRRGARSAHAEQERQPLRRARRARGGGAVGWPWQGRLDHAIRLEPSTYVRYTGEYARTGNFYGTSELVHLLERAAFRVATRLPGAKLSVGELSRAR